MSVHFSKWELVQDSKWPFNIKIMSGDDVVVSQGRYAYTSKDRNLDDVMSAANFTFGDERDNAALANKMQVDALRLAAAAPELLEALDLAKMGLEAAIEKCRANNDSNFLGYALTLDKVNLAITKARGE